MLRPKQSFALLSNRWLIALIVVGVAIATAWAMRGYWWPTASANVATSGTNEHGHEAHDNEHAGEHDHDHAGHSESTSIELSEKAIEEHRLSARHGRARDI